jgi:hypothetical protein
MKTVALSIACVLVVAVLTVAAIFCAGVMLDIGDVENRKDEERE